MDQLPDEDEEDGTARGEEIGEDLAEEEKEEILATVGDRQIQSQEVEGRVGGYTTKIKGRSESVNMDQTPKSGCQLLEKCSEELDQTTSVNDSSSCGDIESVSTTEQTENKGNVLKIESHVDHDFRGNEDQHDESIHTQPVDDAVNKDTSVKEEISDSVTLEDSEQNNISEKPLTRKSEVCETPIPESTDQKSRLFKSPERKADLSNRHSSSKLRRTKFKPVVDKSRKSVSSIDINISGMINGDAEMDCTNTVAMVMTKSVDFSLQSGGDEVEQELERVVGNDDAVSIFSGCTGGRAAATNTPVESHLQHHSVHTPVRDNIYEHALHLIKHRCHSRTTTSSRYPAHQYSSGLANNFWDEDVPNVVTLPTLLRKIDEPVFNNQPNRTFFISQHRPIPLEPLKVWKGYHGNVFFQPLICQKMRMSVSDKIPVNAVNGSCTTRRTLAADNTQFPGVNPETRNKRTNTAKTWNGRSNLPGEPKNVSTRPTTRQMSVLDRQTILSQVDQHFGEDISWLNGTEALGALQVGTGRSRSSAHFYDNRGQHYKLRICRGLVSHNRASLTKENPPLDVSGGKMSDFNAPGSSGSWHRNGQKGISPLSGRHSNGEEERGSTQQSVGYVNYPRASPQHHQHCINSKQVVHVDLTTASSALY